MTRKPKRPHNPATAEHARQQRLEREAEARRMEAQGATVTKDKRTGEILGAHRPNVFKAFLTQKPTPIITQSQYNAAMMLTEAWARWKGLDGRGDRDVGKVDGGTAAGELVTDRMMRAGRELHRVLSQVGPMDRELLKALVATTVEDDQPRPWRDVVAAHTGVLVKDKQSSMIVAALENLRRVYEGPSPQHVAAA
mgnify:CR=1 FL=1